MIAVGNAWVALAAIESIEAYPGLPASSGCSVTLRSGKVVNTMLENVDTVLGRVFDAQDAAK